MIETAELSLDQKSAGIKAASAPAPSRGFALWIVLLLLYFLLLPSAAESGSSNGGAVPGALASALPTGPGPDRATHPPRRPSAHRH